MSAADRRFRDLFNLVIGILVGGVAGIYFVAVSVADRQPERLLAEPEYRRQLAERIAPPVRIAIAGRDNSALAITAPKPPAQAAASAAMPASGAEVFQQVCTACHGQGIGGAPRAGDAAAWGARIAKGKGTLYQHAIEGFKGETGIMPPKGGRTDIPDELIRAAVDQMTGMSR